MSEKDLAIAVLFGVPSIIGLIYALVVRYRDRHSAFRHTIRP
jgi:hypothetical protein